MLAVVPVTAAWFLVTASLWPVRLAVAAAAMHFASGIMLVGIVLIGCREVPFTRASSSGLRAGWPLTLVALHVYAFRLDDLQMVAMRSTSGVAIYATATIVAAVAARMYGQTQRKHMPLRFDAPVEAAVETLNLSRPGLMPAGRRRFRRTIRRAARWQGARLPAPLPSWPCRSR